MPPLSGTIPSSATINVRHTVNYNVATSIKNYGTIRIQPIAGTAAKMIVNIDGINFENYSTGKFYVINGEYRQYRFVGGGNSGEARSGNMKNYGGYMNILNSFLEVAQDWTSEGGGKRIWNGGCLITGQNFSMSQTGTIDSLVSVSVSMGWHGSGNIDFSNGFAYLQNFRVQIAESGNCNFSSGTVKGDIDYITMKNHITGITSGGNIFASPSLNVSTGLSLDAYCVETPANYIPNGKFSGPRVFDCSLTSVYFPAECSKLDLDINKTANSFSCLSPDSSRVFTLSVINSNTFITATGVIVNDLLPAGLSYVSHSGDGTYSYLTGDWVIGVIAANTTRTLTINTVASSSFTTPSVKNKAYLKYLDQQDIIATNNADSVTLAFCPITISGTLYNDADGLQDNMVDGIATGNPSGVQMYAHLVNAATSIVIDKVNVIAGSGIFEFASVTPNTNYQLVLSTASGNIGSPPPAILLPANWVHTGEKDGAGSGSDGTANGILSKALAASNASNLKFGIEQLPLSYNKYYFIGDPALNSFLILNSVYPLLPGPLQGLDPEDGALGAGKNLMITSLPTSGNQLWYNGVQITTGADAVNPPSPTNPYNIINYNYFLLSVKFTGAGSLTTTFGYEYYDAAGMFRPIQATYTLDWIVPLSLKLTDFKGTFYRGKTDLQWKTTGQTEPVIFEIEHSGNGTDFISAGTLASANDSSSGVFSYSFSHHDAVPGANYYRLAILGANRRQILSNTILVYNDTATELNEVFPNPFAGSITVSFYSRVKGTGVVSLIDSKGVIAKEQIIKYRKGVNKFIILNLENLAEGIYFLSVFREGNKTVYHVVKK